MAIDPVCNMEVDEETAQWTSEYKEETYYFCSPGCKRSFDQNPERYASGMSSGGMEGMEHHHDHEHHH